jgi:cyanophycinase
MSKGSLIIIGGHEDREGKKLILREIARRTKGKKLVVTTVASREPEGTFETYARIFREFGVETLKLEINTRGEALQPSNIDIVNECEAVFFTGGDQLKITSQLGDTPIFSRIREIFEQEGGLIAGTSAGASVVCETMLIGGASEQSHRSDQELAMAPGLGFLRDSIVDQHFAERGRMGRLLGAVARNPRNLGIGIDEDTAVIVEGEEFTVLGAGAVYVVDGRNLTYSNIGEREHYDTMSLFQVTLHVLSQGDKFHLGSREPRVGDREELEEQIVSATDKNSQKRQHSQSHTGSKNEK